MSFGVVLGVAKVKEPRVWMGTLAENTEFLSVRKIYHLDVRMSQSDDSLCPAQNSFVKMTNGIFCHS